jgi:hypothetical protein
MEVRNVNTQFKSVEEASEQTLQIIAKFMGVNTLCVTRIEQDTSFFVGAFNREEVVVEVGAKLSLWDAY